MIKRFRINYQLSTLRCDVIGGVTTTVISLPVALGFGIASGMGAAAGLWGAISVGFLAAVFGGTKAQISGPTAPMAVAMAVVLTSHSETLAEALTIAFLAGTIQVLMGVTKIGRYVAYTPHVVIAGFMTGIGMIVMFIQILPILGSAAVTGGPVTAALAVPAAITNVHIGAVIIGLFTLAVGFLWPQRFSRWAPGPIVALAFGTMLGMAIFPDAPVIGEIPMQLPSIYLPDLSPHFLLRAIEPAIILALLGSVESLLTSLVADSMTGSRHNSAKELVGQGVANMAASLIGALPGAGAALGTVVNIRSGGLTAMSGVTRSAVLLALVLGLGRFVEPIPLSALAAVLFKVGWDIMDKRTLFRVRHLRREHLFVFLLVLFLTVFIDLITAVAIGLITGAMVQARRQEHQEVDHVISVPMLDSHFFAEVGLPPGGDPFSARVGMVKLRGTLTVSSSQNIASILGHDIKEHNIVIFDLSETTFIDDSAAMMIARLLAVAAQSLTYSIVIRPDDEVSRTLDSFDILGAISEKMIVNKISEARDIAKELLETKDGESHA